jgi:hypothetical protein
MSIVPVSDPLTLPTWLTAIFTGVLAVGAVFTAIFAIRAFGKQSAELTILKDEADDQQATNAKLAAAADLQVQELRESLKERQDDRKQRRRAQASLVYLTQARSSGGVAPSLGAPPSPPSISAVVHNTSHQPVYDVRVHWVDSATGAQSGAENNLGTIPPGDDKRASRQFDDVAATERFTSVVYFRDAMTVPWTVLADGHLDEADPAAPPGAPVIATTAMMRSRGDI